MKSCLPSFKAQNLHRTVHQRRRAWCWLTGWLMLALYFLDYSPVGICSAALLGSLDPNHEVGVQAGERGVQLVLHHHHGCIGHHHGVIARTLTLFAQPATPTNPDHVIQFGSGDSFSNQKQIIQSKLMPSGLRPTALQEMTFTLPNPAWSASHSPRPPPTECGLLVCLRSTVLLI